MALDIIGHAAPHDAGMLSKNTRLTARKCVVLYGNSEIADDSIGSAPYSFATVHDIAHPALNEDGFRVDGPAEPVIGAARPLQTGELRGLVESLAQGSAPRLSLLPERALAVGRDLLIWWSPARHEPLFLSNQTAFAKECSGRTALHPPLLFIGRPASLNVWALPKSERPTESTRLLQAPYYNIYGSGAMCRGSVPMPPNADPANIDQFERAFFQSAFTHTNMGNAELTSHPKGHEGLWRELIATHHRVFPYHHLIAAGKLAGEGRADSPLTVADVLASFEGGRRR